MVRPKITALKVGDVIKWDVPAAWLRPRLVTSISSNTVVTLIDEKPLEKLSATKSLWVNDHFSVLTEGQIIKARLNNELSAEFYAAILASRESLQQSVASQQPEIPQE